MTSGDDWLRPVLVRARGRSGTTLMMQVLHASPGVWCDDVYPFENRYLTYLVHVADVLATRRTEEHWDGLEMLSRPDGVCGPMPFEPLAVDLDDLRRRSLRHLWSAFSESVASRRGGGYSRYAEKFVGSMAPLSDAGIDADLLRLVRDPRDLFLSVKAFNLRRGYDGFGQVAGQTDRQFLDWFLADVRRSVGAIDEDEALPGVRTALVRYEDVVGRYSETAEAIAGWLGLDVDRSATASPGPRWPNHATTPDARASVGRWRRELPDEVVRRFRAEIGDLLERFGYDD